MNIRIRALCTVLAASWLCVACANTQNKDIMAGGSQVELRSYQTRAFDTTDKTMMLRSVIATLQDLGFVIDKADEDLGAITGTKLKGYRIRMTVVVRPRGETQSAEDREENENDQDEPHQQNESSSSSWGTRSYLLHVV